MPLAVSMMTGSAAVRWSRRSSESSTRPELSGSIQSERDLVWVTPQLVTFGPTRRVGERGAMSERLASCTWSGGTMATGLLLDRAGEAEQALRKDPFLLGGAPPGGVRPEDVDGDSAALDAVTACWTAPFWMVRG